MRSSIFFAAVIAIAFVLFACGGDDSASPSPVDAATTQPDVFDNGNNLHQSRVISFILDEDNEHVSSFAVIYERPPDQPQTTFMGSALWPASDRWFIGWGGWTSTPATSPPSVTELVGGSPVWTLTFAGASVDSYRALLDL